MTAVIAALWPLLLTTTAAATAIDAPLPTLAERVAAQPKTVRAFIARRTDCNHWGGEEPYDAARRREINRAVRDLRCTRLDRDEAKLIKHMRGNAELIALLDAVRDEPGL